MTSQAGKKKKTVTIQILFNISCSNGNQTMKFGQLIDNKNVRENITPECNNIFFLKNHTENEAGTQILDPFLFFK